MPTESIIMLNQSTFNNNLNIKLHQVVLCSGQTGLKGTKRKSGLKGGLYNLGRWGLGSSGRLWGLKAGSDCTDKPKYCVGSNYRATLGLISTVVNDKKLL